MREHFPGTLALRDTNFFTFCLILEGKKNKNLMLQPGFEPALNRLKVQCANQYTMAACWLFNQISNYFIMYTIKYYLSILHK